jgi:two-component system chemotaxis sensor kinase CheA
MVDPFELFAEAAERRVKSSRAARPIQCLIPDAEDPWMRNILAPLLVQAGHDVTFDISGDAAPDIILCSSEQPAPATAGEVPVLVLREVADPATGTPDSIYRYDRETIMAAVVQAARRTA